MADVVPSERSAPHDEPGLVATEPRVRSRRFLIAAASLGNLLEWFDWYLYSSLALYFAPAFFPPGDRTAQLLNAAAVFAVGFLMRPVGAAVLGAYADRHGRKSALTLSVFLMCFGSILIALTPEYETVGIVAPALLLLARLLQGISVGGEFGASATYLSEISSQSNRGFYASFQGMTGIAGQLLAVGTLVVLQFVLTREQLASWGWRIPFVVAAFGTLFVLVLRRSLVETQTFTQKAPAQAEHPLRTLMRHPRAVLTAIGLTIGGIVAYYTYTAYIQKFLVNTVGFDVEQAAQVSALSLLVYMVMQPLFGALSDRIGRKPMMIGFGILGTIFTVPIMTALERVSSPLEALLLILAALFIVSGYTAIHVVVRAELFPTGIRALGIALPYALTVSLFGGTAEYVALSLKNAGHEAWFYWYVTGCIFISLLVYITMPETRGRDLSNVKSEH